MHMLWVVKDTSDAKKLFIHIYCWNLMHDSDQTVEYPTYLCFGIKIYQLKEHITVNGVLHIQ
jgi:hypothetical protein